METKIKSSNTVAAIELQQNAEVNSNLNSLGWDDILVYDEMAEQTSVRTNLLQQIKKQMSQLAEMSARRQFLTKEIMTYIVK